MELHFKVGDSILKRVENCRLKKRIEYTVSVRSIPESSTNGMAHHVKGCLGDISPNTLNLNHGENDLKSGNNSEKTATDINHEILKNQSFHCRIGYQ